MISGDSLNGPESDERGQIVSYLSDIPIPAIVVSGAGEVIYMNDVMARLAGDTHSGEIIGGEWIAPQDNSFCADCPERPRLMPSSSSASVSLLAAIRLPSQRNALIRVYSDTGDHSYILYEDIISGLLQKVSFINKFSSSHFTSVMDEDGLCPASLADMVNLAIKTPELEHLEIENMVDPLQAVKRASPIIVRRVVQNIVTETESLTFSGPVRIGNKTKASHGADGIEHILFFKIDAGHSMGKRMSSELMAVALRLKLFARNMTAATGFITEPPAVLSDGSSVEIQFSFSDPLKKANEAVAFNFPYNSKNLSAREKEVAEMIRAGLSNEKISGILGISTATVKQHLKAIYRKEGVRSRIELIFKDSPSV